MFLLLLCYHYYGPHPFHRTAFTTPDCWMAFFLVFALTFYSLVRAVCFSCFRNWLSVCRKTLHTALQLLCYDQRSDYPGSAGTQREGSDTAAGQRLVVRQGRVWQWPHVQEGNSRNSLPTFCCTVRAPGCGFFVIIQGGAKKRGQPISLQIFWKLHDRIAWKLVNFCNIICWTQSITFFA